MKRSNKPMPVSSIVRRRTKIDEGPEYQRGLVWSKKQKQLLIDTILRDLDIPKFYFRSIRGDEAGREFEVVDGQQRLNAIWEFAENKYRLAKDADPIEGKEIRNCTYGELDEDMKDAFDSYFLDIVMLDEGSQDEVEEMFVRLQNGTTLKAAEKRNALPGNMRTFVRGIAAHPFFQSAGFQNKRYDFDQVAAQCTMFELAGEATNIKNTELEKMYLDNQDFDSENAEAKKIRRVLNFLHAAFPEKTPELKKASVNTLYLLTSMLIAKYAISGQENKLGAWFIDFEKRRSEEMQKPEEERSNEMVSYQNAASHASDAVESIEYRYKILSRDFFLAIPDLKPLDPKRSFDFEQKLAIFRRDDGVCQLRLKCEGTRMGWDDDWHADHMVSYRNGGQTTVENGQVACAPCNLVKGGE